MGFATDANDIWLLVIVLAVFLLVAWTAGALD
jgi:hypothetical protein